MADHDERSAQDIAAIKARVQAIRDLIYAGAWQVDGGRYPPAQVGLRPVYCDQWGKLWRDDGDKYTRIGYPAGRPG